MHKQGCLPSAHGVLLAEFPKARIPGAKRVSEPQNARVPATFLVHYPRIPPAFPLHSPAMKNVIVTPITIAALRTSRWSQMNYERHVGRIEISDAFCPGGAKSASAVDRASQIPTAKWVTATFCKTRKKLRSLDFALYIYAFSRTK